MEGRLILALSKLLQTNQRDQQNQPYWAKIHLHSEDDSSIMRDLKRRHRNTPDRHYDRTDDLIQLATRRVTHG